MEDEEEGDQHHEDTQEEDGQRFAGTPRAAELQDLGDVAEEVLHAVAAAERRGEGQAGLDQGHRGPEAENQGSQVEANCGSHDHPITQGMTDGNLAVVTHQGKEEAVAASQAQEEEHLSPRARDGDSATLHEQMSQHIGDGDQRVAGLREGQHGQDAVHGSVKGPIRMYDGDDGDIATQGNQVCEEEQCKEGGPQA